uniref:Aminopeptidase N n=1 Tax=Micromonas pusilla TaxID=38833 RepID=A0A7S0NIE6_MICPS
MASSAATAEKVAEAPKPIYLKDYTAPDYRFAKVVLDFELGEEVTVVGNTISVEPTFAAGGDPRPLFLNGDPTVELAGVEVNGTALDASAYVLTKKGITITAPPAAPFELKITTKIKPQENTELEGLYKSSGNFCTQCEAEGFRRITFYQDRPDVMSEFTTRITADKAKYPVLLSNGNLVNSGDLDGGKHFTVWEDPFPKPAYLFALVAGDLGMIEDKFTTKSGREVALRIYVEEHNLDKADWAMVSLIKSMKWDEDVFGLEYDLDLFNIVAVDDFNMGAMENKSLNIFNSRLVLATPQTATDMDYSAIEGVVAHEYFHNWTGNRVTCRDWFQLSLKEGLTVFRDQEFSSDMGSRSVKRIGDVRHLRDAQFAEDASPMAHPVRPASYMKIDNFYTLTVYEKGAEVIRMYHTLLGEDGFRNGTDLYFERHDGQAVTTDDFFQAMSDANPGCDIGKLKNWYSQAGTPTVTCERAYDAGAKTYSLTLTQVLPKTPDTGGDQPKVAQLIPVKVGLVDAKTGKDLDVSGNVSVTSAGSTSTCVPVPGDAGSVVLRLNDMSATFTFAGVESEPVPSVLRGFSAPVKLAVTPALTADELLFQLAHDSDPFNRWEAAQKMAREIMCRAIRSTWHEGKTELASDEDAAEAVTADAAWGKFVDACKGIFRDAASDVVDRAWVEEALSFPGVGSLVQELKPVDPLAVHKVVKQFSRRFALACSDEIEACHATCKAEAAATGEYLVDETQTARRSLMGYCMALMGAAGHGGEEASELAAAAAAARASRR